MNSLWFLSLVIGLTCALLATLLKQWARRYMKVTQPRYNPHRRVRIRAFFAEGVDKLLPRAVEALPVLLHLSLSLFFAGLAIYLFNINHTVFKAVILSTTWVSASGVSYLATGQASHGLSQGQCDVQFKCRLKLVACDLLGIMIM